MLVDNIYVKTLPKLKLLKLKSFKLFILDEIILIKFGLKYPKTKQLNPCIGPTSDKVLEPRSINKPTEKEVISIKRFPLMGCINKINNM